MHVKSLRLDHLLRRIFYNKCTVVDGNALAKAQITRIRQNISYYCHNNPSLPDPHLAIILVGENVASLSYVQNKIKICRTHRIKHQLFQFSEGTPKKDLIDIIQSLNQNSSVNGILLQLPLPNDLDRYEIIQSIDFSKDVDCLHFQNLSKVAQNIEQCDMLPCTPAGIMHILDSYNVNLMGLKATVVGRGNLVGYPLSHMLLKRNAQVTICHKYTPDLKKNVEKADLLVACAGQRHLIKGDWIKPGAIVIDAGINKGTDQDKHKIVGDVEFEKASLKANLITPVPGGVGPMTVAMLIKNIYIAWAIQHGLQPHISENEEGLYVSDYLMC